MSKHRFDHMVAPTLDRHVDSRPEGLRRIEVITGVGGRRRWPAEAKARILLESLAPGAVVAEVARRHGLSPQELFGWRGQARRTLHDAERDAPARPEAAAAAFASVVVVSPMRLQHDGTDARSAPTRHPVAPAAAADAASIEIVLGGTLVRIRGAVDAEALAAVLKALRVVS